MHTKQNITQPEKNEILQFATTWMNLEGMMLSEIITQRKKSII